jgi:hypothetical protein
MKTYRSGSAVLPLMAALVFASGVSGSQATEYTDSMDKGFAELDKAGEQTARLNTAVAAYDAANARRLLGVVLMHYRNALDDFHAVAQLQPSNPNPLFFRGVTFSRMGDLIKDYNAARRG